MSPKFARGWIEAARKSIVGAQINTVQGRKF
jgi:hypothetical protein